jgi:3-dehydroquinate dehydratase
MKTSIEQRIEEQFGVIIYKFPVLHHNWEGDGYGYITEQNNERKIILSNHNNLYESSSTELLNKISEYTKVEFDTKKAITLLNTNGKLD